MSWGYKNFDWINDKQNCKCPLCGKYVSPETFGFVNTEQKKFKGTVEVDGKKEEKSCDWQWTPENTHTKFDDMEQLSWSSLLIELNKL